MMGEFYRAAAALAEAVHEKRLRFRFAKHRLRKAFPELPKRIPDGTSAGLALTKGIKSNCIINFCWFFVEFYMRGKNNELQKVYNVLFACVGIQKYDFAERDFSGHERKDQSFVF